MASVNEYEGKIPAFYRRRILEVMLFAHVSVLHEKYGIKLKDAIKDFMQFYGIDELDYPTESALVIYHRVRNNFIWANIKEKTK